MFSFAARAIQFSVFSDIFADGSRATRNTQKHPSKDPKQKHSLLQRSTLRNKSELCDNRMTLFRCGNRYAQNAFRLILPHVVATLSFGETDSRGPCIAVLISASLRARLHIATSSIEPSLKAYPGLFSAHPIRKS